MSTTTKIPIRSRAILNQYKAAINTPTDMFKYWLKTEGEIVYALVSNFTGLYDEYVGMELLIEYTMTDKYPHAPPHFRCLTPNGLYGEDKTVCVSIGQYHPDQYRNVLGFRGFTENLLSGLISWEELGSGINIKKSTVAEKKALSAASHEWNMTYYGPIMQELYRGFVEYSAKWDINAARPFLRGAYKEIMADDRILAKDDIDPKILELLCGPEDTQ